eukprot:1863294-Pyramimonas_sp.AAC.1
MSGACKKTKTQAGVNTRPYVQYRESHGRGQTEHKGAHKMLMMIMVMMMVMMMEMMTMMMLMAMM